MSSKQRMEAPYKKWVRCHKIPYETEGAAKVAINGIRTRKGHTRGRVNVFRCQVCNKFHWGHRDA